MDQPTIETLPEHPDTGGCCEPECGPDTCGPEAVTLQAPAVARTVEDDACCEPDCGPDTCES